MLDSSETETRLSWKRMQVWMDVYVFVEGLTSKVLSLNPSLLLHFRVHFFCWSSPDLGGLVFVTIKPQQVPLSVPTGPGDGARDGWANFEGDTGYEQEVCEVFQGMCHTRMSAWGVLATPGFVFSTAAPALQCPVYIHQATGVI